MTRLSGKRIILSKTNRIGDVVMALPVAAAFKKHEPNCTIIFLCSRYTKALVERCVHVDEIICWDDIKQPRHAVLKSLNADAILHIKPNKKIAYAAWRAGIKLRVGTFERIYHWVSCNKIFNVVRKRTSPLHDAQLDMLYYCKLTQQAVPSLEDIIKLYQFKAFEGKFKQLDLLRWDKFNLIIHPKGRTDSGKREWPIKNFAKLIESLDPQQFNIFITGTEDDGKQLRALLIHPYPQVHDLTGKLSLNQLMHFISKANGLLAGSTGPLHLAAAFGIHTLGLYTPVKGHHPQRWKPLGVKASYVVGPKLDCNACGKDGVCACINDIKVASVAHQIKQWPRQ